MSEFLERMNLRPARSAQPADLARFAPKAKLVPEAQDIPTVLCNITSKQGVSDRFSTDIVQGSKATGRNKQCMMTTKAKAAAAGNPVSQIVIKPLSNHIQASTRRQVKGQFQLTKTNTKPVLGPINRFFSHQRAFVKVQNGWDAFCSYR